VVIISPATVGTSIILMLPLPLPLPPPCFPSSASCQPPHHHPSSVTLQSTTLKPNPSLHKHIPLRSHRCRWISERQKTKEKDGNVYLPCPDTCLRIISSFSLLTS
jgi:hypothetical protein